MKYLLGGLIGLCLCLMSCQAQTPPPSPRPAPPSPAAPPDTVYFSETPIAAAGTIDGMMLVQSSADLDRAIKEFAIQIMYLDETTIDSLSQDVLSTYYQRGILLVSLNTPLSMLAKKAGHRPKMSDLVIEKEQAYFSSVLQMTNGTQHFDGEYSDFFYDFPAMHTRMQKQWLIGACTAGIYQQSQCGEFQ